MRYVRDTSLNPYFTETASLMGLGASPACSCAHPISGFTDSGVVKLAAVVGFAGLVLYFINRHSKGK